MMESVSVKMFEIWSVSQKQLLESHQDQLKAIVQEQKETNASIREVVTLLKDDVATTKAILDHNVQEYDNQVISNEERFKNIFQRNDKIDKILIERAPAWVVFKSFKKGLTIFVSALIIGAASALGGIWYRQ